MNRWIKNISAVPACAFFAVSSVLAASVDYGRDILPILSDKCYHCHGPEEKGRKAKLRLDTKEGALRTKDAIIIPGQSLESELVKRITTTNLDDQMPPPDSNRTLTPKQIELLTRWVEEGAPWGQHWAFVAPHQPVVPQVQGPTPINREQASKVQSPIDSFVLSRLQKEGLTPASEASNDTWLRRVTLDLTGLPPTLPELDAFLADASTNAHEKVVNRLLASPRYGERMATDWLDLARYADTHGYQMDRFRPMWPYRDWVIKAFNQNLPFDQFVTWQVAGDLLPNATRDQRLATAFNRLHNQNEEGGVVGEEYRVAYVVDRVNTFSTAFLGLTTECARCHDHKYDPITQKDFYSLFAFFQNIDEAGQTSYFTDSMPVPTLMLPTFEQERKVLELRGKIAAQEQHLTMAREPQRVEFAGWLAEPGRNTNMSVPGLIAHFSFDEIVSNKVVSLVGSNSAKAVEGPQLVEGKFGKAVELSGENGFTFGKLGHFNRADSFSLSLWLQTPSHSPRFVVLHHSKAPVDAGSRGFELLLEEGRVAFGLHHMWPGNSLKVTTRNALPTNEWVHITTTYDGSSQAAGTKLFINGELAELEIIRDGLAKDITYGGGEPELALGNRFRDNGFKNGKVDDLKIFDRTLTALEARQVAGREEFGRILSTPADKLTAKEREEVFDWFLAVFSPRQKQELQELHALRDELRKFIEPIPEIMTMVELPQPKPAYLLKRGAYDAHGEAVIASTPAALPPFPAGQPTNRLGLARWLLQPDHPLTARVTVNRLWQMMFGRGLVETSDNFGSQGAQPTHPELLDWLALDFSSNGWDVKRALKNIALSSTYRQSSKASSELVSRDPANELLARGPARRLTAEMLRDSALAESGLLVELIGGPSVKPYQPDGLWDIAMGKPKYDQGKGTALHRRSLYTYWKRTVPPPAMMTFDAADRSYCTVRRQNTSTPLQALALLNDVQIVEAARRLSQRMLQEGGTSLEERTTWMFRMVTHRKPTPNEITVLKKLFEEQHELFTADPKAAESLLSVGEARHAKGLDRIDLAAGTVLAQALLNHDATLMRR